MCPVHLRDAEATRGGRDSKLLRIFSQVPGYEQILRGIREGREQFERSVSSSSHRSRVHSIRDVEVQAFILALPSRGCDAEVRRKAYLTFATHWVDDCFDQFEFEPTIKHEIKRYRTDLKKVLGFFGPELATVVEGLYANSLHHAATDQGIHRLLYGGLLAHAESREEQQEYLMEHAEIFLGDLDTRLAQRIRERLSPLMIGLTNKTAQEFWFACEEPYEPSVAALYTLVATPAIYLHDWREEAQEHEAQFLYDEPPSDQDLLVMIDLFEWGVHRYIDERKHLRFEQLRLFVEAFAPVLSSRIREAYDQALSFCRLYGFEGSAKF